MSEDRPLWKQQALDGFIEWLDSLPDHQAFESDEAEADLYSLAEELTALKQEMRSLGRNAARLAESSETVSDNLKRELPAMLELQKSAIASAPNKETLLKVSKKAESPLLVEIGDVAEALSELQTRNIDVDWPFYVSKALRRRLREALAKPITVLSARVEGLLKRHSVGEIASVGTAFDATTMNAAGISQEGKYAPGCVSAVARQGYIRGDEILRQAEVIVEEQNT